MFSCWQVCWPERRHFHSLVDSLNSLSLTRFSPPPQIWKQHFLRSGQQTCQQLKIHFDAGDPRFTVQGVCSGEVTKVRRTEKPMRRLPTHVHEVMPCLKLCLKSPKCDAVNFIASERTGEDRGGLCYLMSTTAHKQGMMAQPGMVRSLAARKAALDRLDADLGHMSAKA